MLRIWLAMIAGASFLIASGVIASMARAQPSVDPATVVTGYEMARNRHDLDAALSYFADNAVITQRNTTFAGKDQIRKYLDTLSTRSRFVAISDRRVSGNIATWTERTTVQSPEPTTRQPQPQGYVGQGTGAPALGVRGNGTGTGAATNTSPNTAAQTGFTVSVEAIIMDGKIQSMAYIFGNQAASPTTPLDGRAQLPATIGFAAVVSVILGVVLVASMGFGRASRGVSSLRGRLLHDLQGWADARQ